MTNIAPPSYSDDGRGKDSEVVNFNDLGIVPLATHGGDKLAFLSAFLDESYSKYDPVFVVAGFVSDVNRWAAFATAWVTSVEKKFGVPYVHMKELNSKKNSTYRHLTNEQKGAMFGAAIDLIREHASFAVSCSVNVVQYNAVTTNDERSRFGTPYTIGVMGCIKAIKMKFAADSSPNTTLNVYLESGHKNTEQAIEILKEERERQRCEETLSSQYPRPPGDDGPPPEIIKFGIIDSVPKAEMKPLQAADILSYGILKYDRDPFAQIVLTEINDRVPISAYKPRIETIRGAIDDLIQKRNDFKQTRIGFARLLRRFGGSVENVPGGCILRMNEMTDERFAEMHRLLRSWTQDDQKGSPD